MTNHTVPILSRFCKSALWTGLLLGFWQPSFAQDTDTRWLLCGPPVASAIQRKSFDPSAPLEFSADWALFERQGISRLMGNVEFRQDGRTMEADQAFYDNRRGIVEARGEVRYRDPTLEITGEHARLHLQRDTGRFDGTRYRLPQQHAHGTAASVEKINENITRLRRVRYTTCNPGEVDWELRAREIQLDRHTRMGSAKGVSVRFKRVPIFYFPYLVFPITDERTSGFLMPDIRLNLSRNSTDIALPYYWNIAPNRDATLIPRFIERRGVMLGGEFRYLTSTSDGQIYGEYLPDDRLYGDDRALLRFRHHSRLSSRWTGEANYNYVSDKDYFVDMGDSFSPTTTTHQERRLTLNYRDDDWAFSGTLLGYQMLIGTTPPYQKLPQLSLRYIGRQQENRLQYHFAGEYTYFDDNARQPTGSRLHLAPSVSFPLRSTATYLIPRLTLLHTVYQLDNTPAGMAPTPSRTLPLFSLDGGLFLERFTKWGEAPMLQTLEPRLFYLYAPYRNQDGLPLFDTSTYTFNYLQLFQENRFTNADRINDANQLTVGLTSRFLETDSGIERLRASIGQIIYFQDRRVTLRADDPVETRATSDLAAELRGFFRNHWSLGSSLIWDPESERSRRLSMRLQYKRDNHHLFTVDYRHQYLPESDSYRYKRLDLSGAWALNRNWYLLSHWDYDLEAEQTRETLFGFGYDSCCWSMRLISREFRPSIDAELDRAIFVNLELKGLSDINGKRIDGLLKNGILGYEPDR